MAKHDKTAVSFDTGMLSFARSLQISEGLFYGTFGTENGEPGRVPVAILEKGVRGQSSEDKAKNAGKSSPQTVEFAVVPQGCDGIDLEFSVLVLPNAMSPHACDIKDVRDAYRNLASAYARAGGFRTLAELIVWNIANGRFAWRNRFQTDQATVKVGFDNTALEFNPLSLRLDDGAGIENIAAAMTSGTPEDLDRLVDRIAAGLSEPGSFRFSVIWSATMEPGQEIFPSQEYIRESKAEKGLSRVYAKLPTFYRGEQVQQASMHSQKIGAALRHIDIWHGSEDYFAIPVNPYGGVQETGEVLRNPKTRKGFYDLRKNAAGVMEQVERASTAADIPGDIHFIIANLVRGGVFGASKKQEAAAEEEAEAA